MSISKEEIWHFVCQSCGGWWSIASTEEYVHPSKAFRKLFCPYCQTEVKLTTEIDDIFARADKRWADDNGES